jgi:CheY-like chemotaxis protein
MVIMIDDDDDALEIYAMLIEKTDYADHFITHNNGMDALHFLAESHRNGNLFPRYILLDLNMPGLGGVDFIEKYEADFCEHYPNTEIIILTSSVREKDNEEALSYNSVSHFISKPLSKDKLLNMITESLQQT